MELDDFIKTVSTLEAFFEKELSIEQMKDWYEELKNYSIIRLELAIKEAKRSCKFLPKLVEIIGFIKEAKVEKEQQEKTKCNKCNSVGYIKYVRKVNNGGKILEYEYMAVCSCKNESVYDGTQIKDREHRSKSYTATEEELMSEGFNKIFNKKGIFTGYELDLWR